MCRWNNQKTWPLLVLDTAPSPASFIGSSSPARPGVQDAEEADPGAEVLGMVAIRVRKKQGDLFADGSEAKHFAVVSNVWDSARGSFSLRREWMMGNRSDMALRSPGPATIG